MTPKALSRGIKKLFCFHPRLLCEENNVYGMGAGEAFIRSQDIEDSINNLRVK